VLPSGVFMTADASLIRARGVSGRALETLELVSGGTFHASMSTDGLIVISGDMLDANGQKFVRREGFWVPFVPPTNLRTLGDDDDRPRQTTTINELTCVVCLEYTKDVVFEPCGHLATCVECARALHEQPVCPMCRNEIVSGRRIFIS
jgi:hypothetical protein